MKTVYRFQVPMGDPVEWWIGGDPLHVESLATMHGIEFWAEVDLPHAAGSLRGKSYKRVFMAIGTGQPVPDSARYWGTTGRTSQGFVWHLYELDPKKATRSGSVTGVQIVQQRVRPDVRQAPVIDPRAQRRLA